VNAPDGDATFARAEAIIGGSRVIALGERLRKLFLESARGSRSLAALRLSIRAFAALPAGERGWCAAIAIASASAGHVVMAAFEPVRARPTTPLTLLALLAIALAALALAVADQTREP